MPGEAITSTRRLSCPPQAVWDVLVSPDLYATWYAEPEGFAGGKQLSPGAGIRFSNRKTTYVVTAYEPPLRFVMGAGEYSETFEIAEDGKGCIVTWTSQSPDIRQNGGVFSSQERLAQLEKTAVQNAIRVGGSEARKRRTGGRLNDILSGVFQGYRTPIEHGKGVMAESEDLSSAIDISESDVRIHLRGALAALCGVVLLFSTLHIVTTRFTERGDIVPSSGLSVKQSDDVNKTNAARIEMGQSQSSLELMINCMGERLSPTEFYYCSVEETESNRPVSEMYVTYDAYGRTRSVVFIDNNVSEKAYPFPYFDLSLLFEADMTPVEIEDILGYPASGFLMELSGTTTVFFGVLNNNAPVDQYTSSEAVVRLDAANGTVTYDYNMAYDPENPLAENTLTKPLKYQYSLVGDFVADRAAYERALMLQNLMLIDAEIVLGAEYAGEPEQLRDGVQTSYRIPGDSLGEDEEGASRYIYSITGNPDGMITEIVFYNTYLEQRSGALPDPGGYDLRQEMTLYEVYAQMGVLPTLARLSDTSITLCFGPRINERQNIEVAYAVVVILDSADQTVTRVVVND